MSISSISSKIKSFLGVTQTELIFVILLLLGLTAGTVRKYFFDAENEKSVNRQDIYTMLDSIAEAQRTTYTGTDMLNNPDSSLALRDTVVVQESYFPKSTKKSLPDKVMNLNTASKVQLMKLPGVGEKTAIKIIKYRRKKPFVEIEDIQKVKGIGPKKFDKMKSFIEVR